MGNMIGYFEAIDNKTKEVVAKYKYSTVSDTAKVWLKRNLDHISLRCCCNDKHVEMKISSDLKIYPSKNETGILHEIGCPKRTGESVLLWTIQNDEEGFFYIASAEANAKDYLLKINSITERYVNKKNIEIKDYHDFNKKVYATMTKIKKPDGTILKSTYSSLKKDPEKIKEDEEIFIYGVVKNVQTTEFSKDLLYINIEDIFGTVQRFYIQKDIFKEMYNDSRAKFYRLLAGGFAYKASSKSKIMTISDFYMTSISEYGIVF